MRTYNSIVETAQIIANDATTTTAKFSVKDAMDRHALRFADRALVAAAIVGLLTNLRNAHPGKGGKVTRSLIDASVKEANAEVEAWSEVQTWRTAPRRAWAVKRLAEMAAASRAASATGEMLTGVVRELGTQLKDAAQALGAGLVSIQPTIEAKVAIAAIHVTAPAAALPA